MSDVCPCHGEPWYQAGMQRRCIVKKRAKDRIFSVSEGGRARRRKADAKYRQTHFRLSVGGTKARLHLGTYPVNPEQRAAILGFRAKQRKEIHGRLNTAVA